MKVYGLIRFLVLIFVLHGCSTESTPEKKDKVSGTWNLMNVSGGFAGVDEDFEKGKIIWEFDTKDGTLLVTNNDESGALYNGLPTGTYAYSILQGKDQDYLQLNDKEVGGIDVAKSQLVLDQNNTSSGSGADGFVLVLVK
ncbi:hypothetical protein QSE00_16725 [Arenibacter sp. M-2]|uniref:hypothetical protein n=1 Tax=Arenibacter sp. M-2 TaxID=3053612 RepID=UPI0025712FDA|nr:hypothetical protein [Arenibacter sp. M-2]MDL5513473.1 hypothetical protein [Arenibacter sp. M-2]|tara:strand:+ start:27448 stop:27867 length:420 start_codon:yes stop_codon:yes gene_type:complete